MSQKPNKSAWGRRGRRTSNPEDKHYFGIIYNYNNINTLMFYQLFI